MLVIDPKDLAAAHDARPLSGTLEERAHARNDLPVLGPERRPPFFHQIAPSLDPDIGGCLATPKTLAVARACAEMLGWHRCVYREPHPY